MFGAKMKTIIAACAITLLLSAAQIPPARAQKSGAGLLAAWEQAQKSDPGTLKFEKMKDRQYHFATKRFPFDGDLLLRNAVVEDFSAGNQDGISMGTVEVELQGATDSFYRTYARSYAQWNTTNTLYWEPKTQQWLTSEKYFQQVRTRLPVQAVWPALMGFGWLGILVFILVVLLFSLSRYNGKLKVINQRSERTLQISERNGQIAERNAQIFEQGLKLQEANAKVFQEMLAELKKMSKGS
jgi:hypothetical protein